MRYEMWLCLEGVASEVSIYFFISQLCEISRTLSDSQEYHPHLFGMLVLGYPQEAAVLFVSQRSFFFLFVTIETTRNCSEISFWIF